MARRLQLHIQNVVARLLAALGERRLRVGRAELFVESVEISGFECRREDSVVLLHAFHPVVHV